MHLNQHSNFLREDQPSLTQAFSKIYYPPNVVRLGCTIPKQFVSKSISVGNEIKVHVSDVRNPSRFRLVLKSGLLDVSDLMYYIQEVYFNESQSNGLKISKEDVTRGMFCVALYEGEYNRGLVKKVIPEAHQVEVVFVDYGTVALIDWNNLYFLLEKFSFLPRQAIKAKLADVQPCEEFWSAQEIQTFSSMVGEFKELTARIVHIDRTNKILRVVLKNDENGQSIGDALIKKKSPQHTDSNDAPVEKFKPCELDVVNSRDIIRKQFISNDMEEQDEMEFCVAEICNPSKFWMISKDGFEDVKILLDKLYYTYTEKSASLKIPEEKLKVGLYCVVSYEGEYTRGIIGNIKIQEHKTEIFCIDFGTVSTVDSRELLFLLREFMHLPQQAVQAKLAGIRSLEVNWSTESTQKFSEMVCDYKIVTAKFDRIDWYKRTVEVTLIDKSTNVCINTALVENNLAMNDISDKFEHPSTQNSINQCDGIKLDDYLPNQFDLHKIQEKQEVKLLVSKIINPTQFWVTLYDSHKDLKKLAQELHDTYSTGSPKTKIPDAQLKEGMLCVATNGSESCRVSINRVRMENHQADIFFIDHGRNCSVDLSQLHFMYDKFTCVPRQAFKATLTGIAPLKPETSWSSVATRRFSEMVKEKPLIAKISSWDTANEVLKVLLIDSSADNRKCVNDVLIQEKLASLDF